jgi:hypothetical protein
MVMLEVTHAVRMRFGDDRHEYGGGERRDGQGFE